MYLIKNNANVNHHDLDGWTALHNAASRGHTAIAKALLEAGAHVASQSKTGQTALSRSLECFFWPMSRNTLLTELAEV